MMRDSNVGFPPVVGADKHVVGVVTDRDLAVRVLAEDLLPTRPVGDVRICRPDDDLKTAEWTMSSTQESRLVVADDEGPPRAVVIAGDREHLVPSASKTVGVVILAIVAFCGAGRAAAPAVRGPLPEAIESWVIPNYHLVRPDLASGGQPTESGLPWLRDLGFRIVIDLRAPSEGTVAEQTAVEAAGLRYVSVPVTPETFRREDVDAVAKVLDEPGRGPVLLHCASGNRVGGVWTVLQVMKGRTYGQAEAEGREIGLQSPTMIAAVRRVVGQEPEMH